MRKRQGLSPKFNVTMTHVDPSKNPTFCQGNIPKASGVTPFVKKIILLTMPLATSLGSLYHQDEVSPNAPDCFPSFN